MIPSLAFKESSVMLVLILRILLSFLLLGGVLTAGYNRASLNTMLIFCAIFTIAYIDSKLYLWKDSLREKTLLTNALLLIVTTLIQTLGVSILYLIGAGFRSVLGHTVSTEMPHMYWYQGLLLLFIVLHRVFHGRDPEK